MNNQSEKNQTQRKLLLRLELWFAPLLITAPVVVSSVLLWDWYVKGFLTGSTLYDGELLLGLLILIGNLLFDIPFLRSLRTLKKKH